jgi:cardiolipin synthase
MIRVEGPVVADMRNALVTCATMCTPAGAPQPSMTHGARIGNADAQYVVSTPHDRNAVAMYLEALRLAKHTVHITTPYFIPPPEIVDALTSAAMRGVEVRVLTAGVANKLRIARSVSRLVYGDCLQAGVRIFEYQPTMLHAKCTVVDGVWATIGSVNLDARSLWRNLEANLVTCDETIAAAMEREFFNDLGQAEEITLEAWRRRSVAERVFGVAALPLRSHL